MDFADLKERQSKPWTERPEGVVLEAVLGSRAYGLDHEESDEDRLGVFLAPSDAFFALDDVRETAKNPWADEVLHELGKMCRLLLKVNPSVTEMLWVTDHEICTPVGQELIELRSAFLSAPYCRSAFLGYATSQLGKLKARLGDPLPADLHQSTAKNARHLARLLVSGFGLWSTGHLRVRLDDPQWFLDFGEQVAGGDLLAAEDLIGNYEQLFTDTPTVLPPQPDRERIDAWLRATRQRALTGAV